MITTGDIVEEIIQMQGLKAVEIGQKIAGMFPGISDAQFDHALDLAAIELREMAHVISSV